MNAGPSPTENHSNEEKTLPYISREDQALQPLQKYQVAPVSPPPISTSVPSSKDWSETPRAQTRSEAEAEAAGELPEDARSKNMTRPNSSLEG